MIYLTSIGNSINLLVINQYIQITMRKILIPVLLMAVITSCTNEVQIDKEGESKAIQTVIESMFKSIADFDTETLKTFLCDDFFAYDMNQIMKFEDLSAAVAGLPEMGYSDLNYSVEPVESYIYEDYAIACVKTYGTAKAGDMDIKIDFLESYYMLKTDEGWKIKFFHSTQLPPPPPPETE